MSGEKPTLKRPGEERLGEGDSRHKGPQVGPGVPEGPESWCEGRGRGVPERVAKAGGARQSCRALEIRVWTGFYPRCLGKALEDPQCVGGGDIL